MLDWVPPSVDTFSTLYNVFPSFSAKLLNNVPPNTRVWVEDAGCYVRRSANGKHWDYEHGRNAPFPTGTAAKWIGPNNILAATTSTGFNANVFRGLTYRMPGGKARDVSRLSFTTNGATVTPGGTDAFDLRLYLLGPDYQPLAIAPLFVWKYNAAGSGGAGAVSLNIGAGILNTVFDLPGSVTANLPGLFVLGMIHGYVPATLPAIYVPQIGSGTPYDSFPRSLTGNDPLASATFDRTPGWTWSETFAAGAAPAWGSVGAPDMTTNIVPIFNLKIVG